MVYSFEVKEKESNGKRILLNGSLDIIEVIVSNNLIIYFSMIKLVYD